MSDWTEAVDHDGPCRGGWMNEVFIPSNERPSLFNKYGAMTTECTDISGAFKRAIKDLVLDWSRRFRVHELEFVLTAELQGMLSEERLRQGLGIKRVERWQENANIANSKISQEGTPSPSIDRET